MMSWNGHARQANTYRLRNHLVDTISFQRLDAPLRKQIERLCQQTRGYRLPERSWSEPLGSWLDSDWNLSYARVGKPYEPPTR
jgi:hypothetical protein